MVDINLAIKSQVSHTLHVVDAVKVVDIDHTGDGVLREEGLILASIDPVALDLFCARYMFKNVSKEDAQNEFLRLVPTPRFDGNAIVSTPPDPQTGRLNDYTPDSRVSYPRATLFNYAAGRGLGKPTYYVVGRDQTSFPPQPLVSKDAHFGKINRERFVEIMTHEFYFHQLNALWDVQPSVLAHARATDQLSGSNYFHEFMALDEDGNGVTDDREFGKNGMWDCALASWAVGFNLIGRGKIERGAFFNNSRMLKHAEPGWNVGSVDSLN